VNPPGSAFCNACGHAFDAATAMRASEPRAYTPRHLAERILKTRSAIEGERKLVTVLFCDVVDSSRIAESIGPEAMHDLMDRCIQQVCAAVHRFEGTVNQFLGDGVMALFGAPLALEDAPRRATRAALAIHETLAPLRSEVLERHGVAFEMRIGMHSGPVVVGRIGDDLRMDYTAVGDTTNLAKRLEECAPAGGVLVSPTTAQQIDGFFRLSDPVDVTAKGRSEPLQAYAVRNELGLRGRIDVEAERGLTPLVGRGRELDALMRAFASARDGRGQVVFVVGEAGIGKSRLLYEFHKQLDDTPHVWLDGHCASHLQGAAFHAIVDAVRRAFAIDDQDDDASALEKIAQQERDAGGTLEWTLPYMRSLLSLPSGDEAVEAMDAATRRSETFRALSTRIHRVAEHAPFILAIEDAHWMDPASEEFVAYLTDSVPTARVLVIITHRPGYRHPFGDRSYHVRLAPEPLSASEMGQMAGGVLDVAGLPSDVASLIARKAEGNPLFLEELTRSLLEDGSLRRDGDRIELARAAGELSIPDRIQDVLMARLDRLEDEPKRALQVASVIGREFAMRLLERIHDTGKQIRGVVDDLRALELIYEKALHPELAFMFKHALTHDVAYESVLASRRKALHRVVGSAIEELYADRLAEHYEALAHHFSQGEAWEEAFRYHDLAARKAAAVWANHAAADHCRAALAIADRLEMDPDVRRDLCQRIGVLDYATSHFRSSAEAYGRAAELSAQPRDRAFNLGRRAYSWFWGHHYDELVRTIEACRTVSREHGIDVGHAYADLIEAYSDTVQGSHGTLQATTERALVIAEGNEEITSLALFLEGQHAEWCGDFGRAETRVRQALEIARAHDLAQVTIPASWFLGKALCCAGRYAEAIDTLQGSVDLAERIGDIAQRSRILNTLGWVYAEIGSFDIASRYNALSADLAREMLELGLVAGASEVFGNASINLAGSRLRLGDVDGADEALDPVRAELHESGDPWMRWRYSLHAANAEARIALTRGNLADALAHVDREIDESQRHEARKVEARALELRARILLAGDDREAAETARAAGLGIALEIGYLPVQWRAHALGAELARRRGDAVAADDARGRAEALVSSVLTQLPGAAERREFAALRAALASDPVGSPG
jgi:class 3 adenylate cyclase